MYLIYSVSNINVLILCHSTVKFQNFSSETKMKLPFYSTAAVSLNTPDCTDFLKPSLSIKEVWYVWYFRVNVIFHAAIKFIRMIYGVRMTLFNMSGLLAERSTRFGELILIRWRTTRSHSSDKQKTPRDVCWGTFNLTMTPSNPLLD